MSIDLESKDEEEESKTDGARTMTNFENDSSKKNYSEKKATRNADDTDSPDGSLIWGHSKLTKTLKKAQQPVVKSSGWGFSLNLFGTKPTPEKEEIEAPEVIGANLYEDDSPV